MIIMNRLHQDVLKMIRQRAGKEVKEGSSYEGHEDIKYSLSRPKERQLAKDFLKAHPEIKFKEFIGLIDSLYQAESTNEKSVAGLLLANKPEYRKKLNLQKIDQWLNHLSGWCQVDSLCQSIFSGDEILANWKSWEKLIQTLNKDENINKRRASLVLLTKSVRDSDEEKIADLAFEMVDNIKQEKEILITKAVSWLLREMIKNYRQKVKFYLNKNKDKLPAIAVRETTRKLETGKK